MKLYIATSFRYVKSAEVLREVLEEMGHTVVSMWHRVRKHTLTDEEIAALPNAVELMSGFACEDLLDLKEADGIVFLVAEGGKNGGRHVEFGVALHAGQRIYIVGKRQNAFQYLLTPQIEHFNNVEEFLDYATTKGLVPCER